MAPFRRLLVPVLVALLGALAACSSNDNPLGRQPRPADSFPVGARAAFSVYAHCGVQFARIDGETWRTRLRDDGDGNPPDGWPQSISGTLTRPAADRAVFTSDQILEVLVFHPAPHAMYLCA